VSRLGNEVIEAILREMSCDVLCKTTAGRGDTVAPRDLELRANDWINIGWGDTGD
jgi:hypothetical protein